LEEFKRRIEAFLAETGLAPSAFGSRAVRDPNYVRDLRVKGRESKPSTIAKIEAFMEAYRREHGLDAPLADAGEAKGSGAVASGAPGEG